MRRTGAGSAGSRVLAATALALALGALLGVLLWPTPSEQPQTAFIGPLPGSEALPSADVRSVAGPTYDARLRPPTRDNPQSKVWHQDGAWWALLVDARTDSVRVYELTGGEAWRDTGTVVDRRAESTADALWRDGQLHVATRTSDGAIRYLRYAYDPQRRTYDELPGFPVTLDERGATTVALAVDGAGRAWVGYVQDELVQVAQAVDSGGLSWSSPYAPAGEPAQVTPDDQASIATYGDGRIGLLWSNQRTGTFSFTSRGAQDAPGSWNQVETPVSGEAMADGHVQLAPHTDGRLFAAVKTSRDDVAQPQGRDPLVLLLVRGLDGEWTTHVAGTVGEDATRPRLVLSETAELLYLFTAAPNPGGRIYLKASPLDDIRFASQRGTVVMAADEAVLNNATSTKQQVTGETGVVVLASDPVGSRYHHLRMPVTGPAAAP